MVIFLLFFKEGFNEQTDSLRLGIEEIRVNIDEHLEKLKNTFAQKPAEYLEGIREEITELKYKYRSNLEKREYFSRIRGFYQRKLMQAHPSMTSVKFKEALEELVEKLKDTK